MEKSKVFKQWKEYLHKTNHDKKWNLIQESDLSLGDFPEMEIRRYNVSCTGIGKIYGTNSTFPIRKTFRSKEIILCNSRDVAGAEKDCKESTNRPWTEYKLEQFCSYEEEIENCLKLQAYNAIREECHMYGAGIWDFRLDDYSKPDVRCKLTSCYAPIYATINETKTVIGYFKENGEILFEIDNKSTKKTTKTIAGILIGIVIFIILIGILSSLL